MKKPHCSSLSSLVRILLVVLLAVLAGQPAARAAVGDPDALNLMLNGGVNATVVQPDGKTILVGTFTSVLGATRNRIARLNVGGSLDMTFNPNVNSESARVDCVAVQADGRVVIGGQFTALQPNGAVAPTLRNNLARLHADGTLDDSFNPSPDASVSCLAVRRDGKVLFGGAFGNLQPNGVGALVPRGRLARVDTNGLPDAFNPNPANIVQSLVLQPDDKVLIGGQFGTVAGMTRNRIARVTAGGILDGFNPNAGGTVLCMALQADGGVLLSGHFQTVSGMTRNGIARVDANGILDPLFNPNVPANSLASGKSIQTIAVQANGQVLLGGPFNVLQPNGTGPVITRNSVARVAADGTLDPGFDPNVTDTAENPSVFSIGLQADGKVLLGGGFLVFDIGLPTTTSRIGLARLENDPATQSLTVPSASQVLWTRNGSSPECSVVTFELSTDGGTTWSPLGPDPYGLGTRVGTTANWQLTGLTLSGGGLVRARGVTHGGFYNGSAGLVEAIASFNAPEIAVSGNGAGLADGDTTPDGADHTDFGAVDPTGGAQVRTFTITNSGTAELTLTPGGVTVGGAHAADFAVTLQPALSVAPGGNTTFQVTFDPTALGSRSATLSFVNNDAGESPYNFSIQGTGDVPEPGDLDPVVDNTGISGVRATAVQPDGKTIIAGSFSSVKGVARNRIARLHADHTVDLGFNPNVGGVIPQDNDLLREVNCVAVLADGRVLIGGNFTAVGGTPRGYLARLEANGSLDGSFNPGGYGFVNCLAVQADGKVLVGYGPSDEGVVSGFIVRLNAADGSKDPSFTGSANNQVFSLAVQGDGKVVVGGLFTALAGGSPPSTPRNYLGRFHADGMVDTSFNPNPNSAVRSVAVQADGKVLLGGWFAQLQPGGTGPVTARNYLARVTATGEPDSFNPDLDTDSPQQDVGVRSLVVQADGQVLFGGTFNTVTGTPRAGIARVSAGGALDPGFSPSLGGNVALRADGKVLVGGRLLVNSPATQSLTAPAADEVLWMRGGTAPELARVTFELSTDDGATWSALGAGVRVGTTANWQRTGLALPASGQLRARGVTGNGGSSGLVEAVAGFGVSPAPEIAVSGNGTGIADGDTTPALADHTDFGFVNLTGGTQVRTFTIANSGLMPLTLGSVTVNGAAADFTVTAQPASTVMPGGGTTFQVTFDPSMVGLREAMLSFSNNDPGENPYSFAVQGTGTLTASLPPPVVVNGADVVVAFVGVPGRSYRVQYLTGFREPFAWADFVPPATFTAPASGVIRHTDAAPGDSTRFYRTVPNP